MEKMYAWTETTNGHVMTVEGKNRWFIKQMKDDWYEIYEIVEQPDHCVLRDVKYSLWSAKHTAYLIEVNERNSRYAMREVI